MNAGAGESLARTAFCTRLHRKDETVSIDVVEQRLDTFLKHLPLPDGPVFVAVDGGDAELLHRVASRTDVVTVPVSPWEGIVAPLNALIDSVSRAGASRWIGFISLEARATGDDLRRLANQLDDTTLVAGLALEGHVFAGDGRHVPLSGSSMPWNTFAIWRLERLASIGFLPVSDGAGVVGGAGVEEAPVIARLQQQDPKLHRAKLVAGPNGPLPLDLSTWTPARHAAQAAKIASKDQRVSRQLGLLGLSAGVVEHAGGVGGG